MVQMVNKFTPGLKTFSHSHLEKMCADDAVCSSLGLSELTTAKTLRNKCDAAEIEKEISCFFKNRALLHFMLIAMACLTRDNCAVDPKA
jgi:hypothetical protein